MSCFDILEQDPRSACLLFPDMGRRLTLMPGPYGRGRPVQRCDAYL